jgi:adenosylcobinamide-phosphate synthase
MTSGWDIDLRWEAWAGSAEPMLVLIAALLIDGIAGLVVAGVPVSGGPVYRFLLDLTRRLNRRQRNPATKLIRGSLYALLVLLGGLGIGAAVAVVVRSLAFGWVLALLVLLLAIELGRPVARARQVARALAGAEGRERDPAGRTLPVFRADGLPPSQTADMYLVARGAVEHVAGRFGEGVAAPLFWFVLLGFPGLIACRAVGRAAHAAPEQHADSAQFGMPVARLNEALTWLPVRLAAVLLGLASALVPRAGVAAAFAAAFGQPRHGLGGLAWPIAAVAGALGLSLGGPRPAGDPAGGGPSPWLGPNDGRARAVAGDVRRAGYLVSVAGLLVVGLLALVFLARSGGSS